MKMFNLDDLTPDYEYLQNGTVTLFFRPSILESAITTMSAQGYTVNEVRSDTTETVLRDIGTACDWESLFGYSPPDNLNALNDGVASSSIPQHLLVFRGYDNFHEANEIFSASLMDIFASAARSKLLFGEFLAVFVQVDDPEFVLPELRSQSANWSKPEWLNKDRGL